MAARSYNLNLINNTGHRLERIAHGLCHGEWSTEPPTEILPDHVGKWRSQSGGDIPLLGSIGTGTEGWVRYKTTITLPAASLGGVAGSATAIMTVIWNNPFLGDTQASIAPQQVPVPCENRPANGSTFEPVGEAGLLEVYQPGTGTPDSLAPGQFADVSNVALFYVAPPLFIFGIGNNIAHASSVFGVRKNPQVRARLEPDFAPMPPIERVAPVVGASLEAWVADWTGRSADGAEVVKIRVRRQDTQRTAVHVDDLSGYRPTTFDVVEAPVTGVTFPHVDEVVTAPSMIATTPPNANPPDNEFMRYRPDDPNDIARARNWDNRRVRRSAITVADRVSVSPHVAIEIYGAFEAGGGAPVQWKLRYVRWNDRGKTLIDLLCDGIPPIK